jgi:AraC-like DNA-binding protein
MPALPSAFIQAAVSFAMNSLPRGKSSEIHPMNLERVGPLFFLPETVRRLGSNPAEILAEAGLGPAALDHPDKTIPYAAMGILLETAARQTRCPHFGLELGCGVGLSSLGLVGQMMRHAPTVGTALRDFSANHHRSSRGGVVYLLLGKDHGCWGYAIYHPGMIGSRHVYDAAAMIGLNILRELAGGKQIGSIDLLLSHSEPKDMTPYRRSLKIRFSFDCDQTAFLLPRTMVDQPVEGADPTICKELQNSVNSLSAAGELDVVSALRRTLRIALIGGNVSAVAISAQMGMNRRTLQRRLEAEGTNFQLILDETRYEFAMQLLAHTKLSVAEISLIVGYSEASVLTRGFTQWTGMTPSRWRSNLNGLTFKRKGPSL